MTNENNRSESIGNLALALAKAQGKIKGALRDADNPFFKSRYADLASVWEACREQLAANDICVVQPTDGGPTTVTISTILVHKSGEWMSCSITLAPAKPDPQALGSAITYGRRYGLAAMVGVAPEDDDGNAASGRDAIKATAIKKELERVQPKTILLEFGGGRATEHASISAYLNALDTAVDESEDPSGLWAVNEDTLQGIQIRAEKGKNTAIVRRVADIFSKIQQKVA